MSTIPPVLITGGGGQSQTNVSAVRALSLAGRRAIVATDSDLSLAAHSRHCAGVVELPAEDDPAYASTVQAVLRSENFLTVFPTSDTALLALGWPGHELVDKREVSRRSADAGLPMPYERHFDDGASLLAHAEELEYPIVIKRRVKQGGPPLPTLKASAPSDLGHFANVALPVTVQRLLRGTVRSISGVMWEGRIRAAVHQMRTRSWPRDYGNSACAAVTTEPDLKLEKALLHILAGYNGIFQVQLIGPHVIDINPRVYGSLQLAVTAGVNLPAIVCRLHESGPTHVGEPIRPRTGVFYRWVEADFRHIIESVRGGGMPISECLRALRPVYRTAHRDIALSDPGPTLARASYVLRVLHGQRPKLAGRGGSPRAVASP